MKIPRFLLSGLGLLALCSTTFAGLLPAPIFFVKGDKAEGSKVAAQIPADVSGEADGPISSDGEALFFDGSGTKITFPFDGSATFSSPFSVSVMFEPASFSGYGVLLDSKMPVGLGLRYSSNKVVQVSGGGAGAWNIVTSAPNSVLLGQVIHAAITYDGKDVVIYVNGLETARGELPGPIVANNELVIGGKGRIPDGGEITDVISGKVWNLAIFDRALTSDEITSLCSAGGNPLPAASSPSKVPKPLPIKK